MEDTSCARCSTKSVHALDDSDALLGSPSSTTSFRTTQAPSPLPCYGSPLSCYAARPTQTQYAATHSRCTAPLQ
eukprot:3278128-Rhodomonas_salina.1